MRTGAHVATYRAWHHMKGRCNNPREERFHRYGGRGISYDPSWEHYDNFLADMGEKPEGLTLERKDTNGDYCKDNCKWATPQEQALNKGVYSSSKSGVSGVHFCRIQKVWVARASRERRRWQLYKGPSFEEACKARKAWEEGTPLEKI